MSRYEWESGSIVIPTAQWAGFKKAIRDTVNNQIDKDFALVTRVYEETLKEGKGKRKFNFQAACQRILNSSVYQNLGLEVVCMLFPERGGAGVKPVRPLKKWFS